MAGRILVVDDVATNRIVMKVKLSAACYMVEQADSGAAALQVARDTKPDLILLDVMMPDMSGLDVCRKLREDPETAEIPVVLITALSDREAKMEGLEAGADDFLTKPVEEVTLLARVRSLLRARDTVRELKLRDESALSLGFAEPAAGFRAKDRPGRVALVAPGPRGAILWKSAIEDRIGADVRVIPRETALTAATMGQANVPDIFVVSVDLTQRNEGLRLLSDLRSRPGTRHSATIMVLPEGDAERAAIALDLGANDVLHDPFDAKELSLRIAVQLDRKRDSDRMRAGVQAGLEAAVTDPLTGLHNRRFALHRMGQIMGNSPAGMAVMMVDLDHFKSINDRFGHSAGDTVLRQVAHRLRAQLRGGDLVARIGGEEFLVVLPDTNRERAMECAERLRHAIGQDPYDVARDTIPIPVTASVGLAMKEDVTRTLTPDRMIEAADAALYAAKTHGRDQVSEASGSAA